MTWRRNTVLPAGPVGGGRFRDNQPIAATKERSSTQERRDGDIFHKEGKLQKSWTSLRQHHRGASQGGNSSPQTASKSGISDQIWMGKREA